jgi:protein SCO1/2
VRRRPILAHATPVLGSKVRRFRTASLALVLAVTLAACGGGAALKGAVRNPPLQVGSVSLPGPDGQEVAMKAEPGGLLLVYFGYTSCPDVCPTTMADISEALTELHPDQAEKVTVAMVTVDPERDTLEKLHEYLGHFFSRGLPLRTEDTARLTEVTSAFGVQWEIEEHEPGETYDVAHTALTYVIDDTGTVRVEWPFGFAADDMAADIASLLEEAEA